MAATALRKVDHAALRTNQAVIIGLNLIAFVLDRPLIIALVMLFMLGGTIVKKPGFGWIYSRILKPLGIVKPHLLDDNPEPHRFAQGFGAVVLLISLASFWVGAVVVAWALVWLVVALASLNLFAGFCVGCAMYYWLNRLNVPGFNQAPPEGTIPGMVPR